jgi:hypothetical protein
MNPTNHDDSTKPGETSAAPTKRGGLRVEVKRRVSTGWSVEELGHPGGGGPADGAASSGGRGAGIDGERVAERCHGVLVGVDDLDV